MLEKAIEKALKPINREKTGTNFKKLPVRYQNSIDENLMLSKEMQECLPQGSLLTNEWTTTIGKDRRKIITEYVDGKMQYTVKKGNKILLRTDSKEQVANKIAEFYNQYL